MRCRLANSLYKAMKLYTETGKVMSSKEYGIDYDAIIKKLGYPPAKDYHIDHIQPVSSFDLTDPEQVRRAFAPDNLRWLAAKLNMAINNTRNDFQAKIEHF